jgi:hypothetical protein
MTVHNRVFMSAANMQFKDSWNIINLHQMLSSEADCLHRPLWLLLLMCLHPGVSGWKSWAE